MKFISMRGAVALAATALALSACGGGKATFPIAGTADGVQYKGMVLASNGMELAVDPPAKAGDQVKWAFPKAIEYGDEYAVTVKTPPAHQECTIPDAYDNDTAGRFAQINVPVYCSIAAHFLKGKITVKDSTTGLTKDGLVLINGSTGGTYTANTGATDFIFGAKVPFGVTYGVTVLASPAGLSCTVENGAGTMGDNDVVDIAVNCVPTA
jgi:hypothetical protein